MSLEDVSVKYGIQLVRLRALLKLNQVRQTFKCDVSMRHPEPAPQDGIMMNFKKKIRLVLKTTQMVRNFCFLKSLMSVIATRITQFFP